MLGEGLLAPQAEAMSRDARTLIVMGGYGLAGGTLLGLAAYPATGQLRYVFVGSSVGLYLGVAAAVYFIATDYSSDQLLSNHAALAPGEEPARARPDALPPAWVRWETAVLRF
jgi:hypothetical protein